MLVQDRRLGDVTGITVAAFAEDGFMALGFGFADKPIESGADRTIGIDREHGAIDDAEGGGHREPRILVNEGLALLEGRLGVGVDDDPEHISLGARELKQLEVTAVHWVEIAGGDSDTHEVKGGSGWRLADGKMLGVFRVTGDGHRGIGFSGASCLAFGSRLRVPAAVTRHLKISNRLPLSATTYFTYLGRLPHVEANFAGTYGWKKLSPAEPAERVRLPAGGAARGRAQALGYSSD